MQPKTKPVLVFCAIFILSTFLGLSAFLGCRGTVTAPTGTRRPFAGMTVRIACPEGVPSTVVDRYAKVWASRQKATVEVISYAGEANPPAADAWVIRPARMPHWASGGDILPVPESLLAADGAYQWQQLHTLWRDKLLRWERTPFALPLLGEAPLLFYRTDLFQDAGHRTAYQHKFNRPLAAPATWQDFTDIAEFFKGKLPASLPPLPAADDELDHEFYSVAGCLARRGVMDDTEQKPSDNETFSFHRDLATGNVRLDTPGFVEALRLLRRWQKCRPAGKAAEPARAFADGQAVLCVAEASWLPRFQRGAMAGKFAFGPLPGSAVVYSYDKGEPETVSGSNRMPYLGAMSWLAVVPKGSTQPEAAWDFLAELSGPAVSREIVIEPQWGGGAFRRDHLEKPGGWLSFKLDSTETQHLLESIRHAVDRPGLRNPLLRLRVPDERERQKAMMAELRKALEGDADPKQAMEEIAKRWRQLDEGKDAKARLADYYRSLSLQPPG